MRFNNLDLNVMIIELEFMSDGEYVSNVDIEIYYFNIQK